MCYIFVQKLKTVLLLIVINKHNGSIGNIDSIIISKQEKTGANTPIDSKKF